MQRLYIPLTKEGLEILDYPSSSFPCTHIFADISMYSSKNVPWHWHNDIEIFYVKSGCAKFIFSEQYIIINQSEGGFINRNVLHSVELYGCQSCEIITFIFSPTLFTGGIENQLFFKISNPIQSSSMFDFIKFQNDIKWTKDCLNSVVAAHNLYLDDLEIKEFLVIEQLMHIWILLLYNKDLQSAKIINYNSISETRVKIMMNFIHEHYFESISLDKIAKSANISTRECTRAFKNTIGISPITYLIKYRINIAASLLSTTILPITEIGIKVGFNNSSYFTRMFERYMGEGPKNYRKEGEALPF